LSVSVDHEDIADDSTPDDAVGDNLKSKQTNPGSALSESADPATNPDLGKSATGNRGQRMRDICTLLSYVTC